MNAIMLKIEGKSRFTRAQKLCLAAIAACLVLLLANIPLFAEYLFARGITRCISGLLSLITNRIPVSLYEIAAVLLILGALALIAFLIAQAIRRRFCSVKRILFRLLAAAVGVLLAFGVLYAPLYERDSVSAALGLPDAQVTQESVFEAARYYVERLNAVSARMERDEEGNAVSPLTFAETAQLLNAEFSALDSDYFSPYTVWPKQVALSVPMSYLGITGICFPFTAEANVNVNIPSYELPVTMAHEMSHAKGIARENEANVAAYVLCIRSENEFLQYSGLMNAAAVLLNAVSEEEYAQLRETLAPEVLREYANASAHYAKYDGFIDSLSSFFNDLFLKANGVEEGTRSYGRTVQSLVALYEQLRG